MLPILLEFSSPHLKDFQIKKVSGQATVSDLISILKLDDLVKKSSEVGKVISYTIYYESGINKIQSFKTNIRTDNDEFYFTIICWV